MTRIGLVLPDRGSGWLGGVSYFRNFVLALQANPDIDLEPILFTGARDAQTPSGLPPIELRSSKALTVGSIGWFVRVLLRGLVGTDFALTRVGRKYGVDVFFHTDYLGRWTRFPVISWIPDFQHLYYPDFFTPMERKLRDSNFERVCRSSTIVVVSSETARQDLARFYPLATKKAAVLNFVDSATQNAPATPLETLQDRYGFQGPYFLVPNQFWVHKNHVVIIEALRQLRSRSQQVLVLATGNTDDYRRRDYFKELMDLRSEASVEEQFRILGMVPFPDLIGLMRNSAALLNPSKFEGWSTVVEEAKSLGKLAIISDIAVHREQSPERVAYFDPDNGAQLAECLWNAWKSYSIENERSWETAAVDALPGRRREFALAINSIVRDALGQ